MQGISVPITGMPETTAYGNHIGATFEKRRHHQQAATKQNFRGSLPGQLS